MLGPENAVTGADLILLVLDCEAHCLRRENLRDDRSQVLPDLEAGLLIECQTFGVRVRKRALATEHGMEIDRNQRNWRRLAPCRLGCQV